MFARLTKPGLSKIGWASGAGAFSFFNIIFSQAILSHMLPPSEFGVYLLLSSIVFGAIVFGLLGSAKVVVRLIAEEMAHGRASRAAAVVRRTLVTVGVRGLGVGVVVFIAVYFVIHFQLVRELHGLPIFIAFMLLLWIPAAALNAIVAEMHRGYQDIRGATVVASLPGVLNIAGLLLLSLLGANSLSLAVLCGSSTMLIAVSWGVISILRLMSRNLDAQKGDEVPSIVSSRSVRSISVFVSDITYYILGHLGIWLLAYFSTSEAVAAYGVATRLASLVCFPLIIANLILTPVIAREASLRRTSELEGILRNSASLTVLPALGLCVIYAGFGREILALTFGNSYSSSYILLLILSVGQVANVALGSCGNALVMTGNQRLAMYISVVSALVFLLISIVLTTRYDLIGMAVAASIGVIAQNIFCVVAVRRKLGIWTHMRLSYTQLLPVGKGGVGSRESVS